MITLIVTLLWAKTTAQSQEANEASSASQPNELLIAYGDTLTLHVLTIPDLDQDVRVESDGSISLYLIGAIHVAGQSVTQAEHIVAKALIDGGVVHSPQVALEVTSFAISDVLVTGEVQHPGSYHLEHPTNLANVLNIAGGRTSAAADKLSVTTRRTSNGQQNVYPTSELANLDHVKVFPGDIVTVPRSASVAVLGAVIHPGDYALHNGSSTILQALSDAYGPITKGKKGRVRLIRSGVAGVSEQSFNLLALEERQIPDVSVLPSDILYVDSSTDTDKGISGLRVYRDYMLSHARLVQPLQP